jgi:hypothetical protein
MSNGIASLSFLAASLVALAGCDAGVSTVPAPSTAGAATEPSIRYQVDAANGRIWWLTREGVYLHDAKKPQKLAVPIPGWQWAGEPYGCLPALALGPNGEALVTSDVESTVWKIDPDTLAVSMHVLAPDSDLDKDVGYTALAYSSEHGAFFAVSGLHGSLWKIDSALTRAQKVALPAPMRNACGLSVAIQQKAERRNGLCVRGKQGDWSVQLASDQRSASVRAAPCTDLPSLLSQVTLRSE